MVTGNPFFPRLFEPCFLGKLKLKNRLVMLPMGTAYATLSGEVTERTENHYVTRAKGGVGLVIVGNVSPHLPNGLNQLVLDSDWVIMGHYELAEKVHRHGARIFAQLNSPGRQKYPFALQPGEELVSSSDLPMTWRGKVYPKPRALAVGEIYQVIERYARAAERAKKVGYDGIELHGAHGYLINQFISPFINKRTDEFGGTFENRMRFPQELIKAVRNLCGPDFPIGFRISAVEFVPGGITLEDSVVIAQVLEEAGVAYISLSMGLFETHHKFEDLMRDKEGWREYTWEAVKKAVQKVPIIAGGGLRHPDYCEKLLEEGKSDLIGLARPLLADPEWPRKAREGRIDDIIPCISCNECSHGSTSRRQGGGARRCSVNAVTGREKDFAEVFPAAKPKRVMVIGGGPGGMEAARVAALRGHDVTLYEKGEILGGQLCIAGKPKSKERVMWLRDYLVNQLKKLNVRVELGKEVTPGMVEGIKPDAVVVATGAEPAIPDIPGIHREHVISAFDLLEGKLTPAKKRVVIVGGGMIGCEVADYLLELGNTVTIIEQLTSIASDMEPTNKAGFMELFDENQVVMLTNRKAVGIVEKGVQVVNVLNAQEEFIEADLVIIAVGTRPVNALVRSLEDKVSELYSVGDCNKPRIIMEAIYEGSLAGRQV